MTLTLRPYQQTMRDWMLGGRRRFNRDQMRLGKTPTAIRAADAVGFDRLVLCPAIGVAHWESNIAKWSKVPDRWKVRSYDRWRRERDQSQRCPAVVILDEAHRLKSSDAQQTQAVYGRKCKGVWIRDAAYIWPLSGTPVPNGHAGEWWSHFHALQDNPLSEAAWIDRYCLTRETQYGQKIVGNNPAHLDELRGMIRTWVWGRTQREVWGDAVRINWNVQEIAGSAKVIAAEEERLGLRVGGLKKPRWTADLESLTDAPSYSSLRRLTGEAKVASAVDFIADLIDGGRKKILVGFWHTEVADDIAEYLWQRKGITSFMVRGDTPMAKRVHRAEAFQTLDTPVVLLGQIQAAGEVICLDRADHGVLVETSWVPGQDEQFAQRMVGVDTRGTPMDILALAGTLDESLAAAKTRKYRNTLSLL